MQNDFICQQQCDEQAYADWLEMESFYQSLCDQERLDQESQEDSPENFEDFPF